MNNNIKVLSFKQLVIYEALVKYPTSYAGEIATIVYRDNVSLFSSSESVRTSILKARVGYFGRDGIRMFSFNGQFKDQRPDPAAIQRRLDVKRERMKIARSVAAFGQARGLRWARAIAITVLRCSYPNSSDVQIYRIFQEAFPDLAPKSEYASRAFLRRIKEIQSCLTNYQKATSS